MCQNCNCEKSVQDYVTEFQNLDLITLFQLKNEISKITIKKAIDDDISDIDFRMMLHKALNNNG
jgi:hypothetical protein